MTLEDAIKHGTELFYKLEAKLTSHEQETRGGSGDADKLGARLSELRTEKNALGVLINCCQKVSLLMKKDDGA